MFKVTFFVAIHIPSRDRPLGIVCQEDVYTLKRRGILSVLQRGSRVVIPGMIGRISDVSEIVRPVGNQITVTLGPDNGFHPSLEDMAANGWHLVKIESRSNNRYDHERSARLTEEWRSSHDHPGQITDAE